MKKRLARAALFTAAVAALAAPSAFGRAHPNPMNGLSKPNPMNGLSRSHVLRAHPNPMNGLRAHPNPMNGLRAHVRAA